MLLIAIKVFSLFYLFLILNFLVFCIGGYYFFYIYGKEHFLHRRVTEKMIPKDQHLREIKSTFSSFVAFALMGTLVYVLTYYGLTPIYTNYSQMNWWWWPVSFGIIHTLHDAYFYWSHRLLHGPLQKYHAFHHLSYVPSPITAYSFHFVEALIQAFFFFIVTLIVPTHWFVFLVFFAFQTYINMWGHCIYEFWPASLMTHPILKILNTPTHHVLHHESARYNYSIYYNFWDKICGTNNPEYQNRYQEIIKKRSR